MGGFIGIRFTESRRNVLASVLVWLSTKCLISALINVTFGVYLWIELHQHPRLLPLFRGDHVTMAFIMSFVFAFLLNIVKVKIALDFHNPFGRLTWAPHINWILGLNWVLTYVLLGLGSLCFYVRRDLKVNLDNELTSAMQLYRVDLDRKIEMDRIQIDFRCCGKDGYTDWFNVTWLEHKQTIYRIVFGEAIGSLQNEPLEKGDGHKMVDNVPWSCCDPVAIRPCIHYGVQHNNLHFNYDFRLNTTLYTRGCSEPLNTHFGEYFMQYIIISSSLIGSIESLTLFLMMYLKSSIFESIKNVDLVGDSYGYFLGGAFLFRDIKKGYDTLMEMKAAHLKEITDPNNIRMEQAYKQWRRVSQVISDKFGGSDKGVGSLAQKAEGGDKGRSAGGGGSLKGEVVVKKISLKNANATAPPMDEVKGGSAGFNIPKKLSKPDTVGTEPLVPISIDSEDNETT